MYWDKVSEEILPVDFKPLNPKSNKSIVTIVWMIKDGHKMHITSNLKGEFNDPFLFNIEYNPENHATSVIYDRHCMMPDTLYDCLYSDSRIGFILHDNIVKVYMGEYNNNDL